jgi:hypothetical protein
MYGNTNRNRTIPDMYKHRPSTEHKRIRPLNDLPDPELLTRSRHNYDMDEALMATGYVIGIGALVLLALDITFWFFRKATLSDF